MFMAMYSGTKILGYRYGNCFRHTIGGKHCTVYKTFQMPVLQIPARTRAYVFVEHLINSRACVGQEILEIRVNMV